ncbi:pilus assembly protein PilO [Rahnella woolbedingensis]|uniref:Pilus assembly protein PilO n=1 Tax=Rahnella woolbedingensis TaxID=1510574 RepID=A0A419N647_9GAMM|nr:pilus assembly protein PilO [Rahnella woolbedingensis]RJT42150.1 pilus assembly protein PilO [Rahnella woolbedingensis]
MMILSERLEPLMEKPVWQKVLTLVAAVLFLMLLLYVCGLRGLWQRQDALFRDIAVAQRTVFQSQTVLLRLPPLGALRQELQNNAVLAQESLPLAQQFAQPLKEAGAELLRWSPAVQTKAGEQGTLDLQLNFAGLTRFLYALLQRPEHPAFSEPDIRVTASGLKASVLLTQTTVTGEFADASSDAVAGRDPFSPLDSTACPGVSAMSEWVLSGISQADGRHSGWLLSPDGRWTKVEAGDRVGTPAWTVETLDASQAELSLNHSRCGLQRQTLRLGKKNDSPGKGK